MVITWATSVDSRQPLGVARALGATTRQVRAGLAAALLVPSLPGVLAGVPLGLLLVEAASQGSSVTGPPAIWLATATLGVLAALLALSSVPARAEARRRPVEVLQSEVS